MKLVIPATKSKTARAVTASQPAKSAVALSAVTAAAPEPTAAP